MKKKGGHKWENIDNQYFQHQHPQGKQSTFTGVQCNISKDKNVIRFNLNELLHIRKALELYIYDYKTKTHIELTPAEQQRVCSYIIGVQDKVRRALEDKGIVG
jgi:hypothetical protein